VIEEVPIIDAHEPWLTLIGLRLAWERNAGTSLRAEGPRADGEPVNDVTRPGDPR